MMKVWQPNKEEIKSTENWGIWEKEISKFQWSYDEPETCYILDGEAEVIDKKGNSIRFKKGDMVKFEQGLECTWKIVRDIKKRYKFG
jgi:uncharacterized cupin superfamily protein